jgi:hypothetical protein
LLQRGGYERTVKMLSSALFGITTQHQNPLILPYLQHIALSNTLEFSRHLSYFTDMEILREEGHLVRIPVSWMQHDLFMPSRVEMWLPLERWDEAQRQVKFETEVILRQGKRVLLDLYSLGGERLNATLALTPSGGALTLSYWYELYASQRAPQLSASGFTSFLSQMAQDVNPIFSYSVYKTSKTVWKFSRRKADRFFLMWKYIPPYKRGTLLLRWLKHDLHTQEGRTAKTRLLRMLRGLTAEGGTHTLLQRKAFILTYVFREYRFSLLQNFRTQK